MTDVLADPTSPPDTSLVDELRTWLEDNWDPDLTVAEWWERLGTAGWSAPTLPKDAYGRGLSRSDSVVVQREIGSFGAVGAPFGLGLLLAAPTIADHGTPEQIERYVRPIVTGQQAWCQLFSEPGAGSDLAGLTSKAVQDGDEWHVTGQKVWTSLGQSADMGMLLARTAPDAPKHQGITWFAMDMHQPGVEIRPLREMTGHAMFNEVFLDDARVGSDAIIGDLNRGWTVANTTLGHERAGLGAGGAAGSIRVTPGTVAGMLDKRVGDFADKAEQRAKPAKAEGAKDKKKKAPSAAAMLIGFAKGNGTSDDPTVRQDLVRLHILGELGRLNGERLKATRAAGGDIPGMANISKLSMSNIVRLQRDLGLRIAGPQGTLHAYTPEQQKALNEATGNPFLGMITGPALYAQAPPIYGGTDQIQRNIIGERVLGLPREPGPDASTPFSELPKNA
ncbi:MAG: acyl-CoA dehydrogenase family protein [Actinobacteria bacterium]|nr:acyl-CoA dehydrogenase family protein [Actinomycetota bacterium]